MLLLVFELWFDFLRDVSRLGHEVIVTSPSAELSNECCDNIISLSSSLVGK
ncbi:hypothetical protein AG1IA_05127 [Rhizoctonia solani AG-1 IA]|uniref:Uncharacterized protein n=1 Tax=Thanatephorus cucumeris (strain AG1-IA) TaxID=983506 RepID=L8WWX3_THACA|nr:hypothetical protein AG1IA_05127 [Rhizoctonia solani AG-1 IA]